MKFILWKEPLKPYFAQKKKLTLYIWNCSGWCSFLAQKYHSKIAGTTQTIMEPLYGISLICNIREQRCSDHCIKAELTAWWRLRVAGRLTDGSLMDVTILLNPGSLLDHKLAVCLCLRDPGWESFSLLMVCCLHAMCVSFFSKKHRLGSVCMSPTFQCLVVFSRFPAR